MCVCVLGGGYLKYSIHLRRKHQCGGGQKWSPLEAQSEAPGTVSLERWERTWGAGQGPTSILILSS